MNLPRLLRQSLRMTARDWRAGELRLLAMALVIAVAAVTSVGFFVDRIRLGLERDAAQLLGADLVLSADQPITEALRARAHGAGLQTAETVTFPSMALNAGDPDRNALAAVKAVSEGYPLRGMLRLSDAPGGEETAARAVPPMGAAWVDAQLLQAIGARPGDNLKLGEKFFRIDRVIVIEPDRGAGFINFAPRVMINLADLPATELITTGSRVTYRLLAAGERTTVRAFATVLGRDLPRGQRIESLESGRPEMQRTLERAQRFLALVALLAAMIAAVAVAAAARRFSQRHLDSCAMMRCLGLAQSDIFWLFALEFVFVGIAACAVGMLLGYAAHFALLYALGSLIKTSLPLPSALPAVQGWAVGLVLLMGFALPPLAQLRAVPPLRVLRKDIGLPSGRSSLGYLVGLVGFLLLLLWSSNDLKVGAVTAGGFAGGLLVFALAAWGVLQLLSPLRSITGRLGISWRFAIAAVQRRPVATIVQLVSLAVGLMALLLLTVTRTDLVSAWRNAAPPDAPNRFVINVQPDQVAGVAQRLKDGGIDAELHPMIRGRLVKLNGKPVGPENYTDDRAQRLVDREFNISYTAEAPSHNPITAGTWFKDGSEELSIEEGIAKTLGIKLGDELTFDIAGQTVNARATSLRKVNWDSMRANFFVLMPPALLDGQAGQLHHRLSPARSSERTDGRPAARVPEPDRDRHQRGVPPGPGGTRPGHRGGGVPLHLHARRGRAGPVRGAGVEPRRARPRGGIAAGAGRLAPTAVARTTGRACVHRCAGRLAGGDRRERDRLGIGEVRLRVRLHDLAVGVCARHRRRRAVRIGRRVSRAAGRLEDATAGDTA